MADGWSVALILNHGRYFVFRQNGEHSMFRADGDTKQVFDGGVGGRISRRALLGAEEELLPRGQQKVVTSRQPVL